MEPGVLKLGSFVAATEQDILTLVLQAPTKSCALDIRTTTGPWRSIGMCWFHSFVELQMLPCCRIAWRSAWSMHKLCLYWRTIISTLSIWIIRGLFRTYPSCLSCWSEWCRAGYSIIFLKINCTSATSLPTAPTTPWRQLWSGFKMTSWDPWTRVVVSSWWCVIYLLPSTPWTMPCRSLDCSDVLVSMELLLSECSPTSQRGTSLWRLLGVHLTTTYFCMEFHRGQCLGLCYLYKSHNYVILSGATAWISPLCWWQSILHGLFPSVTQMTRVLLPFTGLRSAWRRSGSWWGKICWNWMMTRPWVLRQHQSTTSQDTGLLLSRLRTAKLFHRPPPPPGIFESCSTAPYILIYGTPSQSDLPCGVLAPQNISKVCARLTQGATGVWCSHCMRNNIMSGLWKHFPVLDCQMGSFQDCSVCRTLGHGL